MEFNDHSLANALKFSTGWIGRRLKRWRTAWRAPRADRGRVFVLGAWAQRQLGLAPG
jgi:hypothetical protein